MDQGTGRRRLGRAQLPQETAACELGSVRGGGVDPVDGDVGGFGVAGAVGAAVEAAVDLDAMPDDLALAVLAHGCEEVDRTFEAVEGVGHASGGDLEGLVVVVAADFASGLGSAPHSGRSRP